VCLYGVGGWVAGLGHAPLMDVYNYLSVCEFVVGWCRCVCGWVGECVCMREGHDGVKHTFHMHTQTHTKQRFFSTRTHTHAHTYTHIHTLTPIKQKIRTRGDKHVALDRPLLARRQLCHRSSEVDVFREVVEDVVEGFAGLLCVCFVFLEGVLCFGVGKFRCVYVCWGVCVFCGGGGLYGLYVYISVHVCMGRD
jgi:hypothetical protein